MHALPIKIDLSKCVIKNGIMSKVRNKNSCQVLGHCTQAHNLIKQPMCIFIPPTFSNFTLLQTILFCVLFIYKPHLKTLSFSGQSKDMELKQTLST